MAAIVQKVSFQECIPVLPLYVDETRSDILRATLGFKRSVVLVQNDVIVRVHNAAQQPFDPKNNPSVQLTPRGQLGVAQASGASVLHLSPGEYDFVLRPVAISDRAALILQATDSYTKQYKEKPSEEERNLARKYFEVRILCTGQKIISYSASPWL